MILFEEELRRLSLGCDGHHATVTLEIETTLFTEDGLVRASVVPVIRRLGEAMATCIETMSVCVHDRERERERDVRCVSSVVKCASQ